MSARELWSVLRDHLADAFISSELTIDHSIRFEIPSLGSACCLEQGWPLARLMKESVGCREERGSKVTTTKYRKRQ